MIFHKCEKTRVIIYHAYIMFMFFFVYGVANAGDVNLSNSISFDKSGVPFIWNFSPRNSGPGLPYDMNDPGAAMTGVCLSSTDTTNGACLTKGTMDSSRMTYYGQGDNNPNYGTDIKLKITSSLGQTFDFKLKAFQGDACAANELGYWFPCEGNNPIGLSIRANQQGMSEIPTGDWTGALKLNFVNAKNNVTAHGTYNIHVVVTDENMQTIYFPQFPASQPVVNLNLDIFPGNLQQGTAKGKTSIDMCLYDGSNSSSNHVILRFEDEGTSAPGRPTGQFSVYLDGADKSTAANRLDYNVSVLNPTTGILQQVNNGVQIQWDNTNKRNILRQVVLPGIPGVSLCVPAPLTLTTPEFPLSTKSGGHYSGVLKIFYMPVTSPIM